MNSLTNCQGICHNCSSKECMNHPESDYNTKNVGTEEYPITQAEIDEAVWQHEQDEEDKINKILEAAPIY